ncbi:uncharacterized protein LOC103790783 isoform X3 [Callithrix jacchus]
MGNCLGRRAGLSCAWCQRAVVPFCECETQSVAAAAPESTTAEAAVLHPGMVEVQHVQPIKSKRRKGLAGRTRSWIQKKWRCKKICPAANEAPLQDPKECTPEKVKEETSPDMENATGEYHHTPVDDPEECTLGSEEEEVASDTEKPAAWCHRRPVEVLQDLILEDIEDDELPRDVEKPAAWCHRRPVEVLQDLILEDIEDDELPRDVEKPAAWCHRRPVEVLQDLILEDIEDDELPRDVEKPAAQYHHRPVEVLQDLVLEDIEDDELPRDVEKPAAWCHRRPVEVLQDLILEDIEDDELLSDVVTVTALNDLSPPEDCRSITTEDDGESSSLAVYEWILENLNSEEDIFPDQQEYPAACPHMKPFQASLSVITEESSSSLSEWMREFVPAVILPGIDSSEEVIAIHKGYSTLLDDGPDLQQEDPSVDAAWVKEATGLQQADQQEYPAPCPHMEPSQGSLSVITEESSSSLSEWTREFVPAVILPGIDSSEEVIAIHKGYSTLLDDGPDLQQEDPSVDAAWVKEATGLQQADQQEYPAACPHMKPFQASLSVITEESSSSLSEWTREFVPAGILPGIESSEEIIAIHKGQSPLWDDELEDSIAGSHQQVKECSKPTEKATKKLKVKKERLFLNYGSMVMLYCSLEVSIRWSYCESRKGEASGPLTCMNSFLRHWKRL